MLQASFWDAELDHDCPVLLRRSMTQRVADQQRWCRPGALALKSTLDGSGRHDDAERRGAAT
jgi:hypothetical protein